MSKKVDACHIVIVDDEQKNHVILKELLAKDYILHACNSGEECLAMCQTMTPDIILLDVVMPGIGGLDTCKQLKLREELKHTRVVLVSSKSLIDDKLKGYMVGADDYLVKPFDYTELLMKMRVYSKLIHAEKHIASMNDSLQKQVELQTQKLMQSEKMASIGQLASGVAHEINNPMCFINTNLEALVDYIDDLVLINKAYTDAIEQIDKPAIKEQLQQQFSAINTEYQYEELITDVKSMISESLEGAERVTTIVHDLKTFARTDDRLEALDINEVLQKSLNVVWNQLKTKCKVEKTLSEQPIINGIRSQLSQVFINLLINSAQAIEQKGLIRIHTERQGKTMVIKICDNGSGIASADLGKIFDPFHTTKPVGVGTGLGLSISYAIIEKHKGKIEVDSEKGKGTCFTITLDSELTDEDISPPPR